ncbi:MAG TPA: hypothetical protein VFQ57_08265, partial [Sphingomonas sp.]|nr:hypothetical protein [Sphingomonas sp.]
QAAAAYAQAADLGFTAPTLLRLLDALDPETQSERAATILSLFLAQNPRAADPRRILARWQLAAGEGPAAARTLRRLNRDTGGRDAIILAALAQAGDRAQAAVAYRLAPMSPLVIAAYADALDAAGDGRAALQLRNKRAAIGD